MSPLVLGGLTVSAEPTPTSLTDLLDRHVQAGALPGAVAAVATGDDVEVAVVGARSLDGPPMTRDTIFRIASVSKPITAAAAMVLVDEGLLRLDDPVARWLPELASPMVVRTPSVPGRRRGARPPGDHRARSADVPQRPRLPRGLLAARGGPAGQTRCGRVRPCPRTWPAPDEWMRVLATIPLLHHPGDAGSTTPAPTSSAC